jgi:hypothetical protein
MPPLLSLRLANRILVTRSKKQARKKPACSHLYPLPLSSSPLTYNHVSSYLDRAAIFNIHQHKHKQCKRRQPQEQQQQSAGYTDKRKPRLVPRLIKGSHRRHKDPPFNQIQTSYSRHSESCFSLSLLTHAYSYATSALTSSSPPASMLQLQLQSYQRGEVKEKK